mmetsp:Transcript_69970/g.163703  ORF Transcript_69970/g.163703 Transcript_69970/m.163703 type:complete len:284 (-) Transcript_69970:82-933(-)
MSEHGEAVIAMPPVHIVVPKRSYLADQCSLQHRSLVSRLHWRLRPRLSRDLRKNPAAVGIVLPKQLVQLSQQDYAWPGLGRGQLSAKAPQRNILRYDHDSAWCFRLLLPNAGKVQDLERGVRDVHLHSPCLHLLVDMHAGRVHLGVNYLHQAPINALPDNRAWILFVVAIDFLTHVRIFAVSIFEVFEHVSGQDSNCLFAVLHFPDPRRQLTALIIRDAFRMPCHRKVQEALKSPHTVLACEHLVGSACIQEQVECYSLGLRQLLHGARLHVCLAGRAERGRG